jgi:hypothetical protein
MGSPLGWERLDDRRASRISLNREISADTFDRDPELAEWAAEAMVKIDRLFRPVIKALD